ncbi:MAG: hypothetical protein KatS3mg079_652 [Caloramator sp.]|nr:MAG: hypothetical protein KatS3mg079_652 [Caloramator sp.]
MRVDYNYFLQKRCSKCERYSEKPVFGKCIATKSDILTCAWREWQQNLEKWQREGEKNDR